MFDDMRADMESDKKLSRRVNDLFFRGRKINISLAYLKVIKTIRLKATHYFIMKIPNKRYLKEITSDHSSDIDIKNFMNLYKE